MGPGYSSSGHILGRSYRLASSIWRSQVVPTDPLEEVMIFGVSRGVPTSSLPYSADSYDLDLSVVP